MFRSRSWFGGGLWKPKNPHSLEHLKYLYNVLSKNQSVSETNRGLLVETLRSIAEILIWGDQNDSSVFDFFLEKNMLSFFLKIMKQKCGSYVCVQLLQTLNILFENIRNETSLYYLLSNNHVNSIIVHKFDFSDEEVMAYYISFLKTLSLKLNAHTVHFFYNEHTNDFPLYTEAIKFFNHPESMVRIAVRTLTLNVYRVEDRSMLKFIRDKTAAPYFSNLVWFIGNHVLELDICVRNDADHQSQNRLSDLVAEHLDHLHYLNDILCLDIADLNQVLTDHLLNKLLIPLYVYSLTKRRRHSQLEDTKPHVSSVVSLFLLSQVFLIITHKPLVQVLAWIILNGDMEIFSQGASDKLATYRRAQVTGTIKPGFVPPTETLEKSLETSALDITKESDASPGTDAVLGTNSCLEKKTTENQESNDNTLSEYPDDDSTDLNVNITDEEKERLALETSNPPVTVAAAAAAPPPPTAVSDSITVAPVLPQQSQTLSNKPFLEMIFNTLQCSENDYSALFALCLLYALGHNQGVNEELIDTVLLPSEKPETRHWYNVLLVEKLIKIISQACQSNSRIRLVTLELSIRLLIQLVMKNGQSFLRDGHLAAIEGAKEESVALLRNFYKSEEIFLDMFEDEYNEMKKRPLNVEWLMMDSNILLPPTGTPMTGIEFSKRLPCGEVERARRAIRVFFLVRDLSLTLRGEPETQLPLTNPQSCVQVDVVLDLNNSDLIACTVVNKEGHKIRRFLVIDVMQFILVEPDTRRLGWGVTKFVGFLQDIEVTGDKDDSRCLHITVHRPLSSSSSNRVPLLSAKFIFDDHIRCMAAKQRLTKGRIKARQKKMHMIARLLDLPSNVLPCPSPPPYNLMAQRAAEASARSSSGRAPQRKTYRRFQFQVNRVPGFAAARGQDSPPSTSRSSSPCNRRSGSQERVSCCELPPAGVSHGAVRSREGSNSPRLPRPRSEEIPLEDMSTKKTGRGTNGVAGTSGSINPPVKMRHKPLHHRDAMFRPPMTPSPVPQQDSSETAAETTTPVASDSIVTAPLPSTSQPSSTPPPPTPPPQPPPVSSEETSFTQVPDGTQSEEKKLRRKKGMVETV
ncbi:protein CLEC16A homolog isoform X1 [Schistocerca serialis cubense]|uniref:protein CLEC16A homolog isoform X1 n=1 Tax=Schistocerca serialis cubense TaxID=2023355 RepID=UPI00214F3F7E|nr:protein CLEC16A homolog isoform X1 [Schistocerca serialis cubense]